MKKTNPEFDVAMGAYDGAKICELVGLYLLDQLSAITGKHNTDLYRDDGLAVLLRDTPGPDSDRLKKQIIQICLTAGATDSKSPSISTSLKLNSWTSL